MSDTRLHWHAHNRFQLLVDSQQFFPQMLTAIRSAQKNVYLEQYLVASGKAFSDFVAAFTDAARRGVSVCLLLDDYGAKDVQTNDIQILRDAGVLVSFYNPFRWASLYSSLRRNHRKLLLIDNTLAFVGGAGISDVYLPDIQGTQYWHDTVVRIEGAVVKDWQTQFIATWRSTTNIDLPAAQDPPVVDDSQHGRVALANGPGKNQILRHAIANMKKSSQIVWIATPYFVITRKLRHALLKAAFRGIDVRLLLPGDITDHLWLTQAARRFYTRLLKNKVHIYEYQPRFIHAKLILCDHWVSIGSSNLDRWNHFWNLDANQEILDPQFAVQVRDLFEGDFQLSKKILLDTWRQRPWRQRIEEWWSSYKIHFIQWLTFFATRRRKKNGLE